MLSARPPEAKIEARAALAKWSASLPSLSRSRAKRPSGKPTSTMLANIANTFAQLFQNPELKSRILFTLVVLAICRVERSSGSRGLMEPPWRIS